MITLFQRVSVTSSAILALAVAWPAIDVALADDFLPTEKECKKLENPDAVMKGWCVTINRRKGNCLACHQIVTDKWPAVLPPGGNIAPPLVAMKQRYPDKDKLRSQIWNALEFNNHSVMPPFGKHKLISEEEIDNIVEFLLTI